MARYHIPARFRSGFNSLIELDNASLELLTNRLSNFPIGGGHYSLVDFLHDLPIANIDEIASTIYSFGNILIDRSKNIEDIANGLVKSYLADEDNNANPDKENHYITILVSIFISAVNVKISYKAMTLATDVPNIFRESNIICDIRMVFADDISDARRNAIISQQIKLVYSENGEEKVLYVNADRQDLESLRDQIDRAISKEKILKNDYSEVFNIIEIGD
ncbi:hypothetical protein [uncultured Pedobacter sp.]|uniref:hypothetical protein n=1 Tax=uncultured Pedobacter sp. TaxID=246139 RepID=UPI0025ECF4A1|nr:hypothetical protein [uncultured Pedobacter sp.]